MSTSPTAPLDRALQRQILTAAAERYPAQVAVTDLGFSQTDPALVRTAMYLHEHGLLSATASQSISGPPVVLLLKATAKGLDFLQDDGGLTALLGVLTVRLDAETLRGLIDDKIDATPMQDAEKSKLKGWLSAASSEALKEATKRLVAAALDHAPDALRLLQTLPG